MARFQLFSAEYSSCDLACMLSVDATIFCEDKCRVGGKEEERQFQALSAVYLMAVSAACRKA